MLRAPPDVDGFSFAATTETASRPAHAESSTARRTNAGGCRSGEDALGVALFSRREIARRSAPAPPPSFASHRHRARPRRPRSASGAGCGREGTIPTCAGIAFATRARRRVRAGVPKRRNQADIKARKSEVRVSPTGSKRPRLASNKYPTLKLLETDRVPLADRARFRSRQPASFSSQLAITEQRGEGWRQLRRGIAMATEETPPQWECSLWCARSRRERRARRSRRARARPRFPPPRHVGRPSGCHLDLGRALVFPSSPADAPPPPAPNRSPLVFPSTLLNDHGSRQCAVCGGARPAAAGDAAASGAPDDDAPAEPPPENMWCCDVCTYHNAMFSSRCVICTRVRTPRANARGVSRRRDAYRARARQIRAPIGSFRAPFFFALRASR